MTEGTRAVNGTTDMVDGGGFGEFLDQQAEEFGEPDVGEEVFDELEDEDEEDDLDEYEDEDDEELEDDEEEDIEEEGEEEGESEGRNLSTDDIIAGLEEIDPSGQAANAVRGMRRKMMQNINEFNNLKGEMLDLREEFLDMKDAGSDTETASEEGSDEVSLPQGITEEQVGVVQDILDHLGFTHPDDQRAADASTAADQYSLGEMQAAVEEYGEAFGVLNEDGSVTLNPEIQARLDQKLVELQDASKGITPRDLFRLVDSEAGRPVSRKKGRRGGTKRSAAGMRRNLRGNVLRRTASASGRVQVRSDRGDDSPEDVWKRSWVAGKRQLTAP